MVGKRQNIDYVIRFVVSCNKRIKCIIVHNLFKNCEDVAEQLGGGSAHIWTFRCQFIVRSAWTSVGVVALERVADAETFIFATKMGRPALSYRIL